MQKESPCEVQGPGVESQASPCQGQDKSNQELRLLDEYAAGTLASYCWWPRREPGNLERKSL